RWMAPELLLYEVNSANCPNCLPSCASDIYSFGCVALELYSGRVPFYYKSNDMAVVLNLARGHRPRHPGCGQYGRDMPDELWEIIGQCWAQNPADR
ncbi:hypothetical protein JAAARDRAFT_93999, partial [Jaapia argillacea MUCL 33604]